MAWLACVLIAGAVIAVVIVWRRPLPNASAVRVAHTAPVRASHRFQSRLARYWAGAIALTVAALLIAVSAAVLAGRPYDVMTSDEERANRDIVLCLDISGSVAEFDSEILDSFTDIVNEFDGERVALVIFNSSARTVFPLSDDYTMINEQLENASSALEMNPEDFYPENYREFMDLILGTEVGAEKGSSLVGDGLVSCSQAFDLDDQERSRTIIFATDNDVLGEPLFTLEEATEMLARRDIMLHSLYIEPIYTFGDVSGELRAATEEIGGSFYQADDSSAAPAIVEQVQAQQESEIDGGEQITNLDTPGFWPVLIAVGLGVLLVAGWRFRL